MKFDLLQEEKIIFHPGKMSDDGQFLDPDGNPYDPIACDPTVLARKPKGSDGSPKRDDISSYVPGSDDDNEDEPWIDIDNFDPYDEDEDDDESYGFDPEEINKEKTIEYKSEKDDEGDEGKEGEDDDPSKEPKDPKDPKKPEEPKEPPKDPKGPKDPKEPPKDPKKPTDPKEPKEPPKDPPPGKPMPTVSGRLIDPHTFVTDDGRTIKL